MLSLCTVIVICFCWRVLRLVIPQMELNLAYVTLTALWKFVHYSPESRVPQNGPTTASTTRVEDCPQTLWLAHERCLKAIKASYRSIVTALNDRS